MLTAVTEGTENTSVLRAEIHGIADRGYESPDGSSLQ